MSISVFLDGEKPKNIDLVLTYSTGIIAGFIIILVSEYQNLGWTILQSVIAFNLTADLVGGVVSNLTESTNSFYQKSNSLATLFLGVHFIQPLLLLLFFELSLNIFLFLYLYMLLSSLIVRFFISHEYQRQVASVFTTAGFVISAWFFSFPAIFAWFPYVYLFKLNYAFSVNHKNLVK